MKIIGLICTWQNVEFFRYALKQALDFCDDVILVEGCHSKQFPKHSTDRTVEFIKTVRNHPKLQVADFDFEDRYDKVQRQIRRDYPKLSKFHEPGNWIIHWDDDQFYFNADLVKLRNALEKAKADSLQFPCRYFIYNFHFNFLQKGGVYIYRILNELNVSGISNAHYNDGKRFTVQYVDNIEIFHYSYVKKPERMKARWVMSIEKNTKKSKGRFEKWMSVQWDNTEESIFKSIKLLKEIRETGEFSVYKGKHPEILSTHPWRHIEDVREI